ncbi:Hsp20/alpha crystallin family protein [Corynebacterium sp. S7]
MADISRWDPFAELNSLQRTLFGDSFTSGLRHSTSPTTDVYSRDGAIVVETHLPNFKSDEVDVDIDGRTLTITASRKKRDEDSDRKYVVRESSASFQRRVTLPEKTDTDKIEADLNDGVLTITIPTPDAKSSKKKIDIKTPNEISSEEEIDRSE